MGESIALSALSFDDQEGSMVSASGEDADQTQKEGTKKKSDFVPRLLFYWGRRRKARRPPWPASSTFYQKQNNRERIE